MRSQAEMTIKKAIEAQEMQAESVHGDVREIEVSDNRKGKKRFASWKSTFMKRHDNPAFQITNILALMHLWKDSPQLIARLWNFINSSTLCENLLQQNSPTYLPSLNNNILIIIMIIIMIINIIIFDALGLFLLSAQRTMRELQDVNETLTVQRNSTRSQVSSLQLQISKAEDTQRRLRQQVNILSNSLNQSQDDAKKAEALSASLTHQREVCLAGYIDLLFFC